MTKKVNKTTFLYGGKELSLSKSKTKAAVRYTSGLTSKKKGKRSGMVSQGFIRDFEVLDIKRGADKKLDQLRAEPEVSVGTHVWHVDDLEGADYIPTGYLYVEFKPNTPDDKQRELMDELSLNVREVIGPDAYRVCTTTESPNPIKCAVLLQRNRIVAIAEPEFATSPLYGSFAQPGGNFAATQWHLQNNAGQVPAIDFPGTAYAGTQFKRGADAKVREAWAFLQNLGSPNIKIAVIDTGFSIDHPQLRGDGTKVRNTFNAVNRSADVSPWFQARDGSWGIYDHGTSCAAVAAGALDAQGVVGAAPNARIIPIKLDVLSDDAIVKAFEHALLNGADVISCSLGFPTPIQLSTWVYNTIQKVARQGRGGLGVPIFIAAGNANPASNNQPRLVSDFAAHPDVICVSATNSLDERSSYAFFGPNVFIAAPSNGNQGVGITTATIELGANGRSILNTYTSRFGGTSSATPLMAGICALLLSANPGLSVTQIRSILAQTTDKVVGGYDANGRSQYLGYGRVNALRAVQAARQGGQVAPPPTPTPVPTPTPGPVAPPAAASARGKVISQFLNVRSGAGTTFPKVAELHQGDVVNLLERVGSFWRIGQNQFVSADYIQVISSGGATAPATRTGRVTSPTLNVRSGAAVNFPKVAELKQGNTVSIYETSRDGWHRIGANQWVLGNYIQIV